MLRFAVFFLLFSLSASLGTIRLSAPHLQGCTGTLDQCSDVEEIDVSLDPKLNVGLQGFINKSCTLLRGRCPQERQERNCSICLPSSLACAWTHSCVKEELLIFLGKREPRKVSVTAEERQRPPAAAPDDDMEENRAAADDSAPAPPGEKKRIDSPAGKREDSTENKPSQKVSQSDGNSAPAKQVAGSNKKVNTPTESEGPSRPAEQQGSISERPLRSIYNTIYSVLLFSL
ncbi:hypothetical protein DPX39_030007100 [Trypanosoma brucei equiperdum]|uniref:Uncharacterized protein n=1 Tax=Trypanosoma brucei equiperdum TaxID=630700 RepID=A0A3L6LB78_9TRYP|nr:hypothetical protein DPX39_030007100 [Trypanosoma brucei equiperdum]